MLQTYFPQPRNDSQTRNFTLKEHPEISASGFVWSSFDIFGECLRFCFVGMFVAWHVNWLIGWLAVWFIYFTQVGFSRKVTGVTVQQAPCGAVLQCWTAWALTTQQAEGPRDMTG